MSIESLKQQARRHEQDEEWQKALDQYQKAISALAQDDQTDIGLINRVGDLFVRVGRLDDAVSHYEQAVDLYREAFLPNNAIAVCKKIIRNVPDRHQAYLKIGQIRAEQGFLPDARTNFLTYAERMQQAGDLDESFRALVEFCDLAPDDVDVRMTVADQMVASDRTEEAVEQLLVVYSRLTQSGETGRAAEVEGKIQQLDPSVDVGAAAVGFGGADDALGGFGDIDLGGPVEIASEQESVGEVDFAGAGAFEIDTSSADDEPAASLEEAAEEEVELPMMGFDGDDDDEAAVELPMMGFDEDDDDEAAVELPMMGFDGDDDDEAAVELPMMGFDEDDDDEAAVELPMMGFDGDDDDEAAVELPTVGFDEDEGVEEAVAGLPTMAVEGDLEAVTTTPEDEGRPDLEVELEGGLADFGSEALDSLEEAVEEAVADTLSPADALSELTLAEPAAPPSEPAPEPSVEPTGPVSTAPEAEPPTPEPPPAVVETPPAAAEPAAEAAPADGGGDYVDLGAMILGGVADEEKSTRFKVAYEEPSGDEEADFAKMLTQFKEKVAENLDSGDVRAHYDLGTAYKEMGLLEEAISSFQQALRASSDHLPTYEQMGQTFLEMGQAEAAVRTLERALRSKSAVEDEFLGIYYYLARAYEALDNRDAAVEYYDRVFALDINFADVTERLRELR